MNSFLYRDLVRDWSGSQANVDAYELDAAQSLVKIQQPQSQSSLRLNASGLNCMLDGQCQEARTKECTDKCHSCEAPRDCDGGDFCDPRSVCSDPNCHEDGLQPDACIPCQFHEVVPGSVDDGYSRFPPPLRSCQPQGAWLEQPADTKLPWYLSSMQSHPQGFNAGAFPDSDFAYQYCGGHGPSPTVDDDFYFDQDSQYPLVGAPLLAQNPPTSYPHSAIALNNQVHPGQLQTSMGLQNQRHPRPRTPLAEERSTSSYSHDSSSFESFENFATTCSRPHSRSSTMSSVPYILACRWTNKPGASSSECGETFDSANDLHSHIMDKHVGLMGGRGRFKAEKEPMICRWKGCRAATEQKRWTALQHVKDHMVCHSGGKEKCF